MSEKKKIATEKRYAMLQKKIGLTKLKVVKYDGGFKVQAEKFVAGQTRALGFRMPPESTVDEICKLIVLNFDH